MRRVRVLELQIFLDKFLSMVVIVIDNYFSLRILQLFSLFHFNLDKYRFRKKRFILGLIL